MDYTWWDEQQPSNSPGLNAGVMNNFGKWGLWMGDIDKHAFVCKYNPHHDEIVERHDYRGDLLPCESYHYKGGNWTEVGNMCVKGYKSKESWAVAEDYCRHQSHLENLVSIHTMNENNAILHEAARRENSTCFFISSRILKTVREKI